MDAKEVVKKLHELERPAPFWGKEDMALAGAAISLIESLQAQLTRITGEKCRLSANFEALEGIKAALENSLYNAEMNLEHLTAQLTDEWVTSQSLRNAANGYKTELAESQRREKAAVRRVQYEWDDILPVVYTGITHHLKTVQPYYAASEIGEKTFELRKDDRNYAVGDILHLYEWDGSHETGRSHYKQVTYILRDVPYVPDGYACLAVLPVTPAAVKGAKIEWRGPQAGEGEGKNE